MKRTYSRGTTSIGELMQTNYEIALNEFMPAFRAAAARLMVNKYGLRQQRAAELLEITQASISKYINEKYSQTVKIAEKDISEELVDAFVKRILSDKERGAQGVMCKACQEYHKFGCAIMVK